MAFCRRSSILIQSANEPPRKESSDEIYVADKLKKLSIPESENSNISSQEMSEIGVQIQHDLLQRITASSSTPINLQACREAEKRQTEIELQFFYGLGES